MTEEQYRDATAVGRVMGMVNIGFDYPYPGGSICGNAPKKLFLREFAVAWAMNNMTFFAENGTDDVTWDIVGDKRIQGKNALSGSNQLLMGKVTAIEITTIVIHGSTGTIDGALLFDRGTKYAFCHVCVFISAG